VRLGLDTHHEGWNVDDLVSDTDVPLLDEHTSVVDALGETTLEDEGLETTLEEVLNLEGKNVIETLLVLIEDSVADHTTHKGLTLEDTAWVLLVHGQKVTRDSADLGQDKTIAPDLTLVLEAVGSDHLELGVKALLVVGTPRGLGGLRKLPSSSIQS